ncbi:hypothetical protein VPHK379_0011 [Vibrio phage K379]
MHLFIGWWCSTFHNTAALNFIFLLDLFHTVCNNLPVPNPLNQKEV